MNFKKIIGEKAYLSPIDENDAEKYARWANDFEVVQLFGLFNKIIGLDKQKKILEEMALGKDHIYAIVDRKMDKVIGFGGLYDIDSINRTAELKVIIGDSSYWGQGFGEEASKLILDYGFNILNLNNVMISVFSFNKRATRCSEKCGFKLIGTQRNAVKVAGASYNIIYMDIIAKDFNSPYINPLIKDGFDNKTLASKLEIV